MILTLYYLIATYLQSWRIQKVCTKIAEKLEQKASVVFYNLPIETTEVTLATSELCTNHSQARISDILWLKGNQRGCSLLPKQSIHLGPWVSFPEPPSLIPFDFHKNEIELDTNTHIYLLLETDIIPAANSDDDVIMVEDYGKPIAWKVDSHFAILIETDLNYFTKFIMCTFMQDNFAINDRLPLIRVESIQCEGLPQPHELIKNHLRKQLISRAMRHLSSVEWEKHLSGLRGLSVFANQATEFEYNKNRTEGKTGIVKPDLIPSKNVEEVETPNVSSKKTTLKQSPVKIEAKVSPMRQVDQNKEIEIPLKEGESLSEKESLGSKASTTVNKESLPTLIQTSNKISHKTIEKDSASEIITKIQHSEALPHTIASTKSISTTQEIVSTHVDNVKRPSLVRNKSSLTAYKPPNILVYSESGSIRDSVILTLKNILECDTYTIYPLLSQDVLRKIWIDNTSLLVICGSVEHEVGECLLEYFLRGGKILSLCSDILHIVLPTYRTAEVREHELVQFSYDRWQKIKMMHYIFCYQPSPVKKHFSCDGEETVPSLTKKPALVCPRSVEMKDLQGDLHNVDVKVLGNEETWNTPSILLATNVKSGGKAVFSQVHLEADPSQFESDETKFKILEKNDKARLEILSDILKKYLEVEVASSPQVNLKVNYQNAYFLGRHESKFELLEMLKPNINDKENTIVTDILTMKFCKKGEDPPPATSNFLPILIHSCPENFSTVDYFDNLRSNEIGRLVIYVPIISSSMHVINNLTLKHGIAVIPRQQTQGTGRNKNQWLSPEGCAMFSLQLHIPFGTFLGQRISLIQHLIAVALIHAILNIEGYENIDLNLKWPNDIYAGGITKIGGLLVKTQLDNTMAICNIGCAINLDNSLPTICLNDLIRNFNKSNNKNIPPLGYEKTLAVIFTEIESLINRIQKGDIEYFYQLYYKYWLHGHQQVTIIDKSGGQKIAEIIGIDDYGYLKVKTSEGNVESVHPDGNSFDMLKGLILGK